MEKVVAVLVLGIVAVSALPAEVILRRPEAGPRYQYVEAGDGSVHLSDLWIKLSDIEESARFNPDSQNVYHLFTRQNREVSQPLLLGAEGLLSITNYDVNRRTIIILHGWMDTAIADSVRNLVPAFLEQDVNVIVVDWSGGADTTNYIAAVRNTLASGESVARFINWLNGASGATASNYHIIGHSLGGHQAGIVARNVDGDVPYVTALDPSYYLWITNSNRFNRNDGLYTEVIHTSAGVLGFLSTLGDADFYPNGGNSMPNCNNPNCDHEMSHVYMAESLRTGGFTGRRCGTYVGAMASNCLIPLPGNLRMGGFEPKTGSSGIYWLQTNSRPPFSRG